MLKITRKVCPLRIFFFLLDTKIRCIFKFKTLISPTCCKVKILIVSCHPSHPTDAGNRAAIMAQVMQYKRMGYDVHFLFAEMSLRPKSYDEMKAYWQDNLHVYNMSSLAKVHRLIMDKVRTRLCGGYWKCDDHYPWGLASYVNRLNEKEHFDAVIIQYMRLSRMLPHIDIPHKAIFTHDVFSYKDLRTGGSFYETCNAAEEAKALQRCPNILAIQEEEAVYFRYLSPRSRVLTVYNPYEFVEQEITANKNLLYVASRMDFNIKGIQWFIDNVWQRLQEAIPEIQLHVAGTVCEKVRTAGETGITLHGRVNSLAQFYGLGNIVINPVFQGTGLKIKTFEALSYGKVTIVHPHSMTGIYAKDTAPLQKAESPEEWIRHISHAVDNTDYCKTMREAAKRYIADMNQYIENQYRLMLS